MMVLDVIEKVKERDRNSSALQRVVARQVAEIVEDGSPCSNADPSRECLWSYRVPYPGVRYYSYQER